MRIGFLAIMFIFGACFGSFLCCQARRLHLKTAFKKRANSNLGSRSICLHCHKRISWYDNIPIISWLALKGKCRNCHHAIGAAELISEIGVALAFLGLGFTIDVESASILVWSIFFITLSLIIALSFLAIYDGLYGELPLKYLILAIFISIIVLVLKEIIILQSAPFSIEYIINPVISVLILGGLYFLLYIISSGQWVGDGDWLLATAIGLALFHPWLALITLFLSNAIALIVMYPFVKKSHQHQIYFGPFMVIAFIITLVIDKWQF